MPKRRVFFSFHYERDAWRAAQVRNMGVVEGNEPLSPNDWEEVRREGDAAIERWIDKQMEGRTCCIVLIGSETATRKWVCREIEKAWEKGLGLLGIYIHNLKDQNERQDRKGDNPFSQIAPNGERLDKIVPAHDPPYSDSQRVYNHIKENIAKWIEEAIALRERYTK